MGHRSFRRVLIVDPLGEYGDVAVQVHSPDELATYLARTAGRWRVAYHNDHLEDDFDGLCRAVYAMGRALFVVEEADWFCEPAFIPEPFERVIKYGRHRGVHPLCISRSPAEVHRTITRQAWEIYCFAIAEPIDLEYLRRYVGASFAEGLPHLPPLTYRWQDLQERATPFEERRLGEGETARPAKIADQT